MSSKEIKNKNLGKTEVKKAKAERKLPDFMIKQVGTPTILSLLLDLKDFDLKDSIYVNDQKDRVIFDSKINYEDFPDIKSFEKAGPRNRIFFNPDEVKAGIVTCGGLCPGLNDVIRSIVLELENCYKVRKILGFRYGYAGLTLNSKYQPVTLNHEIVDNIHLQGGTILGSSRGNQPVKDIVKNLVDRNINILFCIGGDGTLRGAHALVEEIEKQGLEISVIGIPKTIDNDISFVECSFGFRTAVEISKQVLECARIEASCTPNGVGLVKLMGRDAGFITSYATRANGNVDYCLIPEMKFPVYEKGGLYDCVRRTLGDKGHALIAVAEGAGQHIIGTSGETDASGNPKFNDIGQFMRYDMAKHFKDKFDTEINVRYISPSYVIRSVPANSQDKIFCADLARYAVDAAMAGKTDMMIGYWHNEFTHVPLEAIHNLKKRVEQSSREWTSVIASTGQPPEWW